MGMSPEACTHGGGSFFRSPCITLYQCIDLRPRKGDPEYNPVFEDFVVDGEIDIYNPYDEEQCIKARTELGHSEDEINDHEVCKKFNELMCDPFLDDIEFLADIGTGDIAQFKQVEFRPIAFPKDAPLFFEPLPPYEGILDAEIDEEKLTAIEGLERAQHTLDVLMGDASDALSEFQGYFEELTAKTEAVCTSKTATWEKVNMNTNLKLRMYCAKLDWVAGVTLGKVVFGKGFTKGKTWNNKLYNACIAKVSRRS